MAPRIILYAAVTGLFLVPAAYAQKGQVIGSGGDSCGMWTAQKAIPIRRVDDEAWIMGYFSAVNRFVSPNGDLTGGVDGMGLVSWMDNYCATHPLDMIETGALKLYRELRRTTPAN
jgi:hypothetical protein